MLISPADVRRLMEADDPDATLTIYQGRTVVIPGDDLTANRYPGALYITSQQACWIPRTARDFRAGHRASRHEPGYNRIRAWRLSTRNGTVNG
jgi:hypothetical protein